jgi:hypothetical protein
MRRFFVVLALIALSVVPDAAFAKGGVVTSVRVPRWPTGHLASGIAERVLGRLRSWALPGSFDAKVSRSGRFGKIRRAAVQLTRRTLASRS